MNGIYKFIHYYNLKKISIYIKTLVFRGFLVCENNRYKLTPEGLQIAKEIEDNCSIELSLFVSKYNISL